MDRQKAFLKMHRIWSHGGNANQDHEEIEEMLLHSSKNGYYQRDKGDKSWEGRRKGIPSWHSVGGNTPEYIHYARRYGRSSEHSIPFVVVLFITENGDNLSADC